MYGIRYLRVFIYVSVSEFATGPVREREVYPERPQMEKKPTHLSLPYGDYCLATRGGGETSPQGLIPLNKNPKKEKIQKPTGEFESVNTLSSDSGRDVDKVKGAGGFAKAGEGRNQIPFCVHEIRLHHFAVD